MRSSILPDRIIDFFDRYHERLLLASLLLFVVLIPYQWIFPPVTAGIVAFWLIFILHSKVLPKWKKTFSHPWSWVWIGYYVWIIFGVSYSPNPHEGWLDVTLKITLLLWPLGFTGEGREIMSRMRLPILRGFLLSLALSDILLLILASADALRTGDHGLFFYHHLARWEMIPMHYMALYNSFGALVAWGLWMRDRSDWKWIYLIAGVISLMMVGLLSVRIQFLALPFSLLTVTLLHFRKRGRALMGLASVLAILLVGIMILPGPQRRIKETFDEFASINGMVNNKQTNHRVFIWRYGAEIISENPLLGVGTGGAEIHLREKFKDCKAKFWNGTENYTLDQFPYNFHNVFMQAWGTNGLPAFLILLGVFLFGMVTAFRHRDAFLLGFLLLSGVSFMTESMLERQAGVLFFGFFLSFLLFSTKKEEPSNKE